MTVFYWGIEEEPERTCVIKPPKKIKTPKRNDLELSQEQMADWVAEMDQMYLDRHESLVRLMQAPSGAGERCKRRTSESELDIDATALKQHSEAYLGGINYL
jgi:hypothetical protein